MVAVIAILSGTALAGLVVAALLLRSHAVASWSKASISGGFAHSNVALLVAFALCGYASFTVWASRALEVEASPDYFVRGPVGGIWCALLFCFWVAAHAFGSWRAHTSFWKFALCLLISWSVLLYFAQFGPLRPLVTYLVGR